MKPYHFFNYMIFIAISFVTGELFAQDYGHYRIDDQRSDVRILVFKKGLLNVFGHNHVIRAAQFQGEVTGDLVQFGNVRFKLLVPLAGLVVDDAEDRGRSGDAFTSEIDPESKIATRNNMLGPKCLDQENFTSIHIDGSIEKGIDGINAITEFSIKDRRNQYIIPLEIEQLGGMLQVRGKFSLLQSDFGIVPFSLLGGVLSVRDEIVILFDMVIDKKKLY